MVATPATARRGVLRSGRHRRGAGVAQQAVRRRWLCRPHLRGRGLHVRRPGEPLLSRAHATQRRDVRTAGHLYVYFSYGVHHCVNIVTGGDGRRAGRVDQGDRADRRDRPDAGTAWRGARRSLTDGPGKLTQALGLDLTDNGRLAEVYDDGVAPPDTSTHRPRVGITRAADWPRRYRLPAYGRGIRP